MQRQMRQRVIMTVMASLASWCQEPQAKDPEAQHNDSTGMPASLAGSEAVPVCSGSLAWRIQPRSPVKAPFGTPFGVLVTVQHDVQRHSASVYQCEVPTGAAAVPFPVAHGCHNPHVPSDTPSGEARTVQGAGLAEHSTRDGLSILVLQTVVQRDVHQHAPIRVLKRGQSSVWQEVRPTDARAARQGQGLGLVGEHRSKSKLVVRT
jgi:hypothetical protein